MSIKAMRIGMTERQQRMQDSLSRVGHLRKDKTFQMIRTSPQRSTGHHTPRAATLRGILRSPQMSWDNPPTNIHSLQTISLSLTFLGWTSHQCLEEVISKRHLRTWHKLLLRVTMPKELAWATPSSRVSLSQSSIIINNLPMRKRIWSSAQNRGR